MITNFESFRNFMSQSTQAFAKGGSVETSARKTTVFLSVLVMVLYASLLIADTAKMLDLPKDLQAQLQGTGHATPGLQFIADTKSYAYSAPERDVAFQPNLGENSPA